MSNSSNQNLEKDLQESRNKLQTLISNLPGMAYKCKNVHSWTMEFVSEGCYDLTGFKPGEIMGNKVCSYNDIIHPDDRQRVWEKIQEGVKKDERFEVEYRIFTKENELKWVLENGKCTNCEGSGPEIIEGFITDITGRKKAEKARQKALEKAREKQKIIENIFNTNPNVLYIHDLDENRTVYQNRHIVVTIGYTAQELKEMGDVIQHLAHPEDLSKIAAHFERLKKISDDEILELEYRMRHKNGQWRWIYSKDTVYTRDKKGRVKQIIGSATDITDLKTAQEKVLEGEKKFKNIFNNSSDAIFINDLDGNLLKVNKVACERLGYTFEEFSEMTLADIDAPEDRKLISKRIEMIEKQNSLVFETHHQTKDGRIIPFEVSSRKIEYEGQPCILSNSRDITERKKRIEALKKSENKYRILFNTSPVPLWQGDFTELSNYLEELKKQGISDIRAYLEKNPEEITTCAQKVKIVDVNQAALQLHEAKSKKELKENLQNISIQDSYNIFKEEIIALARGKNEIQAEGVVKTLTGKTKQILLKLKIDQSNPDYVRGIIATYDITERKKVQEKLRIREDRLSKIMLAANDGMWDWDLKTDIVYFDPRYYEMAGYDVDEFPHRFEEFQKRVHPEDINTVMDRAGKHLQGKIDRFNIEFRFRRKNGEWMWILGKGIIVEQDEQGKPLRFVGTHTDITERKEFEQRLKSSKIRYERLFETTGTATIVFDEDKVVRMCNEKFAELYGKPRNQIIDKIKWPDFVHQDDLPRMLNYHENRPTGKPPTNYEFKFVNARGETRFVFHTISYLEDNHNRISSFLDITEQKQIEERLRESEEKYKSLYENIPGGVLIIGNDHRIQDVNQVTCDITGYSKLELVGQLCDQICPKRGAAKECPICEQGSASFQGMDTTIKCKDGRENPILKNAATVYIKDEPVIIETFQDTSFQKKTERELKKSEEKFKSVFTAAGDGIIIVNKKTQVLDVNTAFSEITGIPKEYVIGKSGFKLAREFVSLKQLPAVFKLLKSLVQKEPTPYFELKYNNKILSLGSSISQDTGYFIGVIKDITEKVKAEREKEKLQKQLLQTQKLESIGTLAGGVAHDFNNILTVIMGFSELLLNQTDRADPKYSHLESIHDSSKRAAKLTKQLLLFSRKQDMEFDIIDINDTVYSLNKMLNRLIGEDISMHLNFGDDIWPINADENQIEQVITNLAVNARDAMPGGGELTISTKNIIIDEEKAQTIPDLKPGKYIQIKVKDTGTGIEKSIQEQIFDPFFTTKGRAEGTGMGLSVVHGIIKKHNGVINVYSEPGEGTIFKIYLPAVEEQKTQKEIAQDTERLEQYKGSGETILIVEDEEPVLTYLENILSTYGYHYLSAKSGEEALELFKENKDEIELLISDVIMTGMDGLELARKLKKEDQSLGVILSSGYSDKKVSKDTIKDEAYKFIQKPYNILKLLKTIKKSINGNT